MTAKRIYMCPRCCTVGAFVELSPEQVQRCLENMTNHHGPTVSWAFRALWCTVCNGPILLAWLEGLAWEERRQLVGLPPERKESAPCTKRPKPTSRAKVRSRR